MPSERHSSTLYPFDDDALDLIEGWLRELEEQGCIRRYLAEGKLHLDIPKWLIHQKIDRPSKSKLPEFVEASRGLANDREGSMLDSRSLTLDPGPRTREQILAAETVNEGTSPAYVGAREARAHAHDDLSDLEPAAWDDPRQFGRDRAMGGAR